MPMVEQKARDALKIADQARVMKRGRMAFSSSATAPVDHSECEELLVYHGSLHPPAIEDTGYRRSNHSLSWQSFITRRSTLRS